VPFLLWILSSTKPTLSTGQNHPYIHFTWYQTDVLTPTLSTGQNHPYNRCTRETSFD
jgi:ferric iron reductase protein FhuF